MVLEINDDVANYLREANQKSPSVSQRLKDLLSDPLKHAIETKMSHIGKYLYKLR